MTVDLQSLLEERDALKREVEGLGAQVKLLVRAEHAVTRTRINLDRQLHRIRRLAEFALNITGVEDVDVVLTQARDALLDFFTLDGAAVLSFTAGDAQLPASVKLQGPAVADVETSELAEALWSASTSPGSTPLPRVLLWVPLRIQGALQAVLLGWTSRMVAHHRDLPSAEHVTFLGLFDTQITRALDNAALTAELRASNQRLQSSLQELELTQAQLVQAQKLEALGRLAGGIAHDFNNILTVIVSHAELLRPAVEPQSDALDDLDVILDAANRAGAITRRLLAFGRQQEHRKELVDLNAITMDLSRMLKSLIGGDVRLQLELDTGIGRVRADPVQIEQILMNLVVNARDAMPDGGTLTIETRPARDGDLLDGSPSPINWIALTVSDTGAGIDEATRRRLFEPFFTTKPVGQGTGLGLATVYGLARQNEGQVSVKSAPGEGAHFTVLLPTVKLASESDRAKVGRKSPCVLVVEDEGSIRRMVSRVLRSRGYEVREARDGLEGLEVAKNMSRIDLVVADVVMPAMGGPELVDNLRQARPGLRVIFMSGFTFDHLDIQNLRADYDCFLPKPFTIGKFNQAVDGIMSRGATEELASAGS